MSRGAAVILSVVCSAAIAFADESSARKLFDDGERAYNLGEFDKAVSLFKQAYEAWPEPAFLFNVAQTYRQMGDCKQAVFFYKRFLALKEQDTKKPLKPERKAEIENRIAELDACVKRELAAKPPTELDKGGSGTQHTDNKSTADKSNETDGETDDDEDGEQNGGEASDSTQPHLMSIRAILGAAKLGAGDLATKFQFGGTLVGGYPLTLAPKFQLELGAAISFSPVPYTTSSDAKGTASLIGILANVAPTIEVIPKLSIRADLGVGVLAIPGLGMADNPFTTGPADGALSALHVRGALSADYAVTPNIVVTLTPISFGYSPPPAGFIDEIKSLTLLAFFAGVGYRQ
jgi:hypothetical protein